MIQTTFKILAIMISALISFASHAGSRSLIDCARSDWGTFGKATTPGTKLYWVSVKLEYTKESGEDGVVFGAFQTPNKNITDDEILKLIKPYKKGRDQVTILNGATQENLSGSAYQEQQCNKWLREKNSKPAGQPGTTT